MPEKKLFRKANLVYEDCNIKPGHIIKLYGKETIVKGFHASYNDALGRWETIILTEGRGDPFERSLADIEVLEDQPDESPAEQPVVKQINREWINHALVEFALWYHKTPNKDIANDSCEYLNDKLKEAGVEYILLDDEKLITAAEQPGREVEAVTFTDWVKHNTKGYDPIVEKWVYGENEYRYTTTELYNLFKGRPAEWSGGKEK